MIVAARQSVAGIGCCAGWRSSRTALSFQGGSPSVALDVHLEDGRVVDEAVDHGQGHGGIREDLAPLTERLVCGDEDGAAFVAGTDELEQDAGLGLILADVGEAVRRSGSSCRSAPSISMRLAVRAFRRPTISSMKRR